MQPTFTTVYTIQDLIDVLMKIEDKNQRIHIGVGNDIPLYDKEIDVVEMGGGIYDYVLICAR